MTEPESQTSPLITTLLAMALFLCLGAVILFALMAGLIDARNHAPATDPSFTAKPILGSYATDRSGRQTDVAGGPVCASHTSRS